MACRTAHPASQDHAVVDDLLNYCGGLPLALTILAGRAQSAPGLALASLAGELHDAATRLAALDDQDPTAGLPEVLSWSYTALPAEPARLFSLLALAPGPDLGVPAAADLAGVTPAHARILLRGLEDAHLVRQHVSGRYRLHDLVRLYAASRAEHDLPNDEAVAALRRLVDGYLRTAYVADLLLEPHHERIDLAATGRTHPVATMTEARAWFSVEHATLLEVQRLAADLGWHQHVWQLAWTTDTFHWRHSGRGQDAIAMWQAGLAAATRLADVAVELRAHRCLGQVYALAGNVEQATYHLHRSLMLTERTGDRLAQAHVYRALTRACDPQPASEPSPDDNTALAHATKALHLYRKLGEESRVADMLCAVGWYQAKLGRHEQAYSHSAAALALAEQHGNVVVKAGALDSLGFILSNTGEHTDALRYYRQALDTYRGIGHAVGAADTLYKMGDTYRALGRDADALASWAEAVNLHCPKTPRTFPDPRQ